MGHDFSYEIDCLDSGGWSQFLLQFSDVSIYQTWSYGAVRWGKQNLNHVILRRAGKVVAAAQVYVKKVPGLRIGIAYVPWGPLWQKRDNNANYEDFRFIIRALVTEYCKKQRLVLRINPNMAETDTNATTILGSEGFELNRTVSPYRTFKVDLRMSLEEIRKKLDQKWRNQLNRAEKNGLSVVEGNSSQLYEVFLSLQKQMLERKAFIPGVNYDEFGRIQADLPEFLKMHVAVAEFEGEPVAVGVASGIGDTGIYLLGATGDNGLRLKGSYLVQWNLVQWLKASGCLWYDLGGINPDHNPGVFHFKSGLSGVDLRHMGQYQFSGGGVNHFALRLVEAVRSYGKKTKLRF